MNYFEKQPFSQPSAEEEKPAISEEQLSELHEGTMEAVEKGTAIPTAEGMSNEEIASAFEKRLESMSPQELEAIATEFEELAQVANEAREEPAKRANFLGRLENAGAVGGAGLVVGGFGLGGPLGAAIAGAIVLPALIKGAEKISTEKNEKMDEVAVIDRTLDSLESIQEALQDFEQGDKKQEATV